MVRLATRGHGEVTMTGTSVFAADGTRLEVREAGPEGTPPVVLVHGWAQSSRVWEPVRRGQLGRTYRLLMPDLRGHGESDAPESGYDDPATWAGDLAAVLRRLGEPAVLVGWSYGGLVVTDYLREFGTTGVAGLALVGAITEIGRGHRGGTVGATMRAALPDGLSEDPALAVPALTAFTEGMSTGGTGSTVSGPVRQELLGAALLTPPRVRAALFARDVDSAGVLAAVDVPALVVHGLVDSVVDPAAGEYAAALLPRAATAWLPGIGHLPFHERPARFAQILDDFVARCSREGGSREAGGSRR